MAITKKTAVIKWEEELAKQADIAAGLEATTGTGQFFSLRAGQLAWQGAAMPNNQMAVVVLDSIHENVFYKSKYDPDAIQGPSCFAFGRDESDMAPHQVVFENNSAENDTCNGCPQNEWGSSEFGRGKACRNSRRLALIPAGTFAPNGTFTLFDNVDHYENAVIGYLKLPVTSVKGYALYVKQVAGALRRPPFGIATRIRVVPDPKSQFRVTFESLENLPDDIMGTVMRRHEEAMRVIEFPYQMGGDDAPAPSRAAQPINKKPRKY